MLRSIPGIVIFEPTDVVQLKKLLPQVVDYYGVVYIRMFRKKIDSVFTESDEFDLFKASVIQEGSDLSIFCSGIMVQETMLANEKLKQMGINADIINIQTIKPIDREAVVKSAKKTGAVLTAENHNLIGGLKSAVSEVLAEEFPVPIKSVGVNDVFGQVGKMPYLKEVYKMRSCDIVSAALELLK